LLRLESADSFGAGPMPMQTDEPIALADMMLHRATRRDQVVAGAVVAVFAVLTFATSRFGNVQGPVVEPFIPICATLWAGAELLTAYLLFTQFSVNGVRAFAYLGAAYTCSGVLTIPYVAYFPGLFFDPPPASAEEQISAWLVIIWHVIFALVIAGYRIYDPDFSRRFLHGPRIRTGLRFALSCIAVGWLIIVAVLVFFKAWLPRIVVGGHFTILWSHAMMLVFVLNAVVALMIVGRARHPSLLQLWLAVALTMSALDGALNGVAAGRYTATWYLAKAATLLTASCVLMVLLSQIGALYRRLGTMAIIDPLTGLRNRRSFDEYLRWTVARRAKTDIAFLLIDIDFFKQYNDRYGHAAGDGCLRRVAEVMRVSLRRSADLVARYGGEEFVVLLPDTTAAGARDVAERIRSSVESLGIAHTASAVAPVVTLSIGVAHAFGSHAVDGDRLFALADGALYDAKLRRNTTAVGESIGAPELILPNLDLPTLT
jgi:diguanylate cyclase (GGDEF)-like protein